MRRRPGGPAQDGGVQAPDGAPYAGYGGFTNFAQPGGAEVQHRPRRGGGEARRRRDPLRLRPSSGRAARPRWSSRASGHARAGDRRVPRARAVLRWPAPRRSSARRCSASPRPGPRRSRRTSRRWRAMSTTSRRCSTRRTGARASTTSADPNGQPYDIVSARRRTSSSQVRGTGARIVNWLQDFSYGRDYGPEEVRAQITASRAAGVDEFLLWDAAVEVHGGCARRDGGGARAREHRRGAQGRAAARAAAGREACRRRPSRWRPTRKPDDAKRALARPAARTSSGRCRS